MQIKTQTNFILDLIVSSIFVLFSMTAMRFLFPEGFNTKFLLLGSKIIILALIFLMIIYIIYLLFNKDFKFKNKIDLPETKDLILIILPMSPVFDYSIINSEYLNINGLIHLFGTTLFFILIFSFILPIIFSYFASLKMLMFSGLTLTFTVLNMAQISNKHNPGDDIFTIQIVMEGLYIVILFLIMYGFFLFNKKIAYVSAILFTVSGIIINFNNISLHKSKYLEKNPKLLEFLKNKNNKIIKDKNIYILGYESYANLETLDHYGFDNKEHIKFLENNGFKIYHGTYSNSALSIGAISRILEMQGEINRDGRHYTSGNALGLDIFKANGYKTSAIFTSPYFFSSSPIKWDNYHPKEDVTKIGGKTLTKAIFEGQFRFDIFDDDFNYNNYLNLKKDYLRSEKKKSLFFTHNKFPGHSQNSGKCNINEKNSYFERMKIANTEMRNDVLNIKKNDKNSIIVLLSDHGPYLTKNCHTLENYDINEINKYDIQDRYGTFLSIYWPEDISNSDVNIMITQDIIPAILAKITNNKNLFDKLKVERKFFDRYKSVVGGANVYDGIIVSGKDKGKALFDIRSYDLSD